MENFKDLPIIFSARQNSVYMKREHDAIKKLQAEMTILET